MNPSFRGIARMVPALLKASKSDGRSVTLPPMPCYVDEAERAQLAAGGGDRVPAAVLFRAPARPPGPLPRLAARIPNPRLTADPSGGRGKGVGAVVGFGWGGITSAP